MTKTGKEKKRIAYFLCIDRRTDPKKWLKKPLRLPLGSSRGNSSLDITPVFTASISTYYLLPKKLELFVLCFSCFCNCFLELPMDLIQLTVLCLVGSRIRGILDNYADPTESRDSQHCLNALQHSKAMAFFFPHLTEFIL